MFKWLTSRNKGSSDGHTAAAPIQVKPDSGDDALTKFKEQLFFEWATETHGDDEGKKLYQAYLEVQRCTRLMSVHGDFVAIRQSLLQVAMAFPNVGEMAAGSYESPRITDGYRRWLARWCTAYPNPSP